MAREHARIKLSIWDDDRFRQLSPPAQHLYFVLLSHNKLDYAGVTDWRPARLAAFSASWTADSVAVAAQELSEQLYLVIDEATEEVLIRSFIRNDEFMDQPNMAVAMRKAHRSIASAVLRGVVIHELIRLHSDKPELKGWARVSDMLEMASVDPSSQPPFEASPGPSVTPSRKGETNPSRNPSVQPSPTTAPNSLTQLPAPSNTTTGGQDLDGERLETLAATNAANPPYCTDHGVDNANAKCHGCRAYREWLERQALQGKRAVRDAIGACSDCDEDGWAYGPDGYTVTAARCALHANHGHARRSA